jgi:hypothetical protein
MKKIVVFISKLIVFINFTVAQAPANDDCADAVQLSANNTGICINTISGTTLDATSSGLLVNCYGWYVGDDVWYKFVASSATQKITVTSSAVNGINFPSIKVFSGNCNSLLEVTCAFSNDQSQVEQAMSGLTVGETYYVSIYSFYGGSGNFDLCITSLNDDCTEAVSLPVNSSQCNPIKGITVDASSSSVPSCVGMIIDDDVWFEFVATASQHKVTVSPDAVNGLEYATIEILSGDCNSLQSIYCAVSSGGSTVVEQSMSNLIIGETYYIRVYSLYPYSQRGSFNICVTTLNDECENAETLVVNPDRNCTVVTNGSTTEATGSSNVISCPGSPDDDVWFKFVATSATQIVSITPASVNGIDNVILQVYTGDCNNLSSVGCYDNTSGSATEEAVLSALTAGETYFLRVYSYNYSTGKGDFTICVTTVNDDCESAKELTVNIGAECTAVTNGSTVGATPTNLFSFCGGNADDDVWYKFVATATTQKVTVTPASANGLSDAVFEVWGSSGDCSTLYPISCENNTIGPAAEEGFLNYLTIGNTYYVRVFSNDYNAGNGDFFVCATSYPNDDCDNATTITVNSDENCAATTHGSTAVTGNYGTAGCSGDTDDDVWYAFNAPFQNLKVKLTPAAVNGISNAVMEIYEGYCSGTLLNCVNNTTGADPEEISLNNLTPGQWYMVRVFSYDTGVGAGDFDICISTSTAPPVNDDCGSAVPLSVSVNNTCAAPVNGTTLFATESMPGCNGTGADDDVWYSFVALANAQRFSVIPGSYNPIYNPMMELFTGTCGSLTSVGCYNYYTPNGFNNLLSTIPGTTYYVRIYSTDAGAGRGDFSICITSPYVLNDECTGAIDVPVNNSNSCTLTVNGTTANSTSSVIFGNCVYGTADDDVWYKFTATGTAHEITVTPAATGGINNVVVEMYEGSCSAYMSGYSCVNNTTGNQPELLIAQGLNPGSVYYVRVYSAANFSGAGAFDICIKNTVINDDCSGAINIAVNDDATCTNTYLGTSVGASINQQQGMCNSGSPVDVWYKFVANNNAYNINITSAATGGIYQPSWELLSGDCNSLTSLGCTSVALTFENLTIGNTYYLRVASSNSYEQYQGMFTICIKSINLAVPNDVCAGAINVPVSNGLECITSITGTTVAATGGSQYETGDVWYKFTATEIAHKIKVSPTADSLRNVEFEVYSGGCGSLTSLGLVNNFSSSTSDTLRSELQSIENFIPGNTYYIRVFGGAYIRNNSLVKTPGSFNICVSLSANDVCSQARAIPVNATENCIIVSIDSLDHSTVTFNTYYCNAFANIFPDSWFKFVALDTSELITITQLTGNSYETPRWQLFSGSCGALNPFDCTTGRRIYGGLTVGETYYLRVYYPGRFSICISRGAINNECNAAIDIPVNNSVGCNIVTNGTTTGSTASLPAPTCSVLFPYNGSSSYLIVGNDVWYKFTATSTQHRITVTGTTPDMNIYFTAYSGDCGSLNTIVCVNDFQPVSGSTDEEAVALDNLIPGNIYYIRVYNQVDAYYPGGDFTICVSNIYPLNDLCSNAILVPVNTSNVCTQSVTGTNVGATRSYNVPGGFYNGTYCPAPNPNADVFYKFIATAASLQVTVTPTASGGMDDVVFEVYAGTCGSPSTIARVDETSYSLGELTTLGNLTVGNTYYIRVYNANGQIWGRGSFTVCVSAPIPNDDCTDAIVLQVNSTGNCTQQTTGTITGATPGNGAQDVWYKFTATLKEHKITVNANGFNPVFTLYKGSCNGLVQVRERIDYDAGGTSQEFQAYDSLTIGETYLIRVGVSPQSFGTSCPKYVGGTPTGTFTICVSAPNPINDVIDQALNVPVNNSTSCTTTVSGNMTGASYSVNYFDCARSNFYAYYGYGVSDVWYKFTATATSHIITVTPSVSGGIQNPAFSVVERINSSTLQQRGCIDLSSATGATESQSFNGLVIGREYYIRVMCENRATYQGAFTLCISTPTLPVNNNQITTFAGGGTGIGVSADNSKLYNPTNVAVDHLGNVYIADNAVLKKINKADGVVSIIAGTGVAGNSGDGGPATSATIALKNTIATDRFGNIFIGDFDGTAGSIRKINPGGIISTLYTLPLGTYWCDNCCPVSGLCGAIRTSFCRITGITTDAAGNVYLTSNRTEAHPNPIGVSGYTTWYWYDIQKISTASVFTTLYSGGGYGYGVTIDATGNLYFVQDNRLIKKRSTAGTVTTVAGINLFGYTGDGGTATQALMKPYDVKADAAGNLYVADGNGTWEGEYGNYSIRKINPAGTISTISGTGINGYSGDDGPANLASMHTPVSIAIDSTGVIYIADVKENESPLTATNRIRKIRSNCSGGIAMSNKGNTFYITNARTIYHDCDTIAKVAPVSGQLNRDVTAKVWIESSIPQYNNEPYLARHYEIMPRTDPATANMRLTLYFSQQEFTNFNSVAAADKKLPIDGIDAANNKAHLLIIQQDGISSNGSGLRETYPGTFATINPDDNDIVWNSAENRWEVSFNTSGFSGFFVQSTANEQNGAYTITVSSGGNGSVSPGTGTVNAGSDAVYAITPNVCFSISDVVVDGVSQGAVGTYTFTNVQADHTITANFILNNYPITVTAGSGGSITPATGNVNCGSNATYTITPNACYSIADVVVDGVSQGAVGTYTFTNVTAAHSISATFSLNTYTITVSAGSNGSITPATGSVNCGVNATYTITPNACYSIADVVVDGVSQGATSSYTFTNVQTNHSISASFVFNTYNITVTAGSNGSITPATGSVNCGSNATFTISPNACYSIQDVVVDGVSQGATSSYSFTNVQTNHSISASFVLNTYNITVTASSNGSITPATGSVNCGSNATYTISPNACYSIQDVVVDGVSQGAVGTYTFTNVQTNHSISASFVLNTYNITATAGSNGSITPATGSVNCGSNATYTISPNACYSIQDVVVDGVSQGATSSYTFTNVQTNHSISASFVLNTYNITVTAGSNGSITPPTGFVNCGGNATYTITPNACYSIAEVVVDGVSQGAVGTYTFTNVTAAHSISATFSLNTYTISVSAGSNGSITPATGSVNCGSNATYTISPNACYSIQDVVVDGVSQGAVGSYTFTNVTAAHSISATFTLNTYTITVTAGSNGSISPATGSVNCGSNATYTISPNACYSIQDVVVDGVSQGAVGSYTFTNVTASHSISATFTLNTYTITVTAGSNGSITPATGSVNCGSNATYVISPNACYSIADVVVDGVSQGAVVTYTFTNVTAAHSISATFSLNTYTITVSAGSNGSITPVTGSVNCGSNATYTISPNACYSIQDVVVDGVSQGATSSYTFTNVQTNHSISASFVLNTYNITVTAGSNGSITPATGSVNCGSNATYTIIPNACYSIQDVVVDGVSQGAVGTYTFTNVTAAHSISATFTLNTYTITVTAGSNGSIAPATGSVNCGSNATYTISPNACYSIQDVVVDGISQGATSSYTFTNVQTNHSISASFVLNTYNITVTAGSNGSITPPTGFVNCGSNATYTISPNACYSIQDVVVDGVSQGAVGSYTFTNVTAAHSISATFSLNTYTITVSAGSNGSITPATGSVNCGSNATYTISPNACYSIQDVVVDGVSQGATSSYTFTNVQTNHSFSASFVLNTYNITATAGANGSITPATGSVNCGSNATFTISPNVCYSIQDVVVDGVSQGAVGTYTFNNVTANHSISATFVASLPLTVPIISGIVNICPYIGTGEQLVYTASVSGASGLTWTVPPNVTIVSGQGTSTLTIVIQNSFTAQQANKQIKVTALSSCGNTTQSIFYMLAQSPVTPQPICGNTNVCTIIGTTGTFTYAIAPVTGATYYVWTAQTGTTTINHPNGPGINDTIITVSFTNGFTSSNIAVASGNNCGTSNARSISIVRANPPMPGLISGPTNACSNIEPAGTLASYSVNPISGASSYTWTVPNGATNFTGQGSTAIAFTYPSGFVNGSISVTATNGCGTGTARTLAITRLLPATPGIIDVIQTEACPNRKYSYTLATMPANASSVQWTIPNGASIISGMGTTSITVSYPSSTVNGNVTAQAFNNCGSSTIRTSVVKLPACPPVLPRQYNKDGNMDMGLAESMHVTVYPNPTVSDFNLKVVTADNEKLLIKLMDLQGRLVRKYYLLSHQQISFGSELKSGVYILEVRRGQEVKVTRLVKF